LVSDWSSDVCSSDLVMVTWSANSATSRSPPEWPWRPHAARADRLAIRPRLMPCCALWRNLVRRLTARGRLDHAHGPAIAHPAERDHPADEREQGVVPAATDARAGVEVGTALAHDDLARVNQLATETLDAQPLGVRVTAVAAG